MDTALRIFILCSLAYAAGYVALWMFFDMRDHVRAWSQRRLVSKLRREHWERFDAAALVKAKILEAGAVYAFMNADGTPCSAFALCGCWRFDPSNGSLGYTEDSKGVIRMFGYTKAEIIYVAEHASEFVGVAPLP